MESKRTTVGRQSERARLQQAYARVLEGIGTFVAVTGEPGIGKTSLSEDFLAALAREANPPAIVRNRCSERLAGSEACRPLLGAIAPARLVHGSGRTQGARAALETVYIWFTEGHDTLDLSTARTLLSETGS